MPYHTISYIQCGYYFRVDFQHEMDILCRLHDGNIVQLLGACTQDEPWCMIVEYLEFGDMNQFLRKRHTSLRYCNNCHYCTAFVP